MDEVHNIDVKGDSFVNSMFKNDVEIKNITFRTRNNKNKQYYLPVLLRFESIKIILPVSSKRTTAFLFKGLICICD